MSMNRNEGEKKVAPQHNVYEYELCMLKRHCYDIQILLMQQQKNVINECFANEYGADSIQLSESFGCENPWFTNDC